ncbi:MAG: alpha/beta fold hydrolase [Myxococcota bacterium]
MSNADSEEGLVVAARTDGARCPIWSIHPIGGSVLWIRELAASLPADQPVYGIQARGLDGEHEPHRTIEAMAAHYVSLIRGRQPNGPYRLSGASFGGTVAFEVAQRLEASGESVELLALFDTFGPGYPARRTLPQRIRSVLGRMRAATWRERFAILRRGMNSNAASALTKGLSDLEGAPMLAGVRNVISANTAALVAYRPQPYPGPIVLFRATRRPAEFGDGFDEPTNGWAAVATAGVEVIPVDADHRYMLDKPFVSELCQKFAERVDAAPGQRPSVRTAVSRS